MLVLRKPCSSQPQGGAQVNRSSLIGGVLDRLWLGNQHDGRCIISGLSAPPPSVASLTPTASGVAILSNGTLASSTIPAITTFPIVLFGFGYFNSSGGSWALCQLSSGGGGYLARLSLNSATAVELGLQIGFGTTRFTTITIPSSVGAMICMAAQIFSATDYRVYCNGQMASGTLSAGTMGSGFEQHVNAGGYINGGLLATGYGVGRSVPDEYLMELTLNHANVWAELIEPQQIYLPVAITATAYAPVGLAAETDTALALAGVSVLATGMASEADTALALAGQQIKATGLASEADTALALGGVQLLAVGLAAEADTALALAALQLQAVGLAAEADSALALAGVQILAAGMAEEMDTALALAPGAAPGATGLAVETDTAFALTALQLAAVGLAVETDAAFALTGAQLKAAGLASEVDTALALGAVQIGTTGLASETDSAFALVPFSPGGVGMAEEADTALALAAVQLRATGLASEADSALALTALQSKATGLALETDTALPLAGVQLKSVGLASETDTALGLSLFVPGGVGMAVETDTAFALAAVVIAPPDAAIQAGSSGGGARRGPHADEAANRRIKAMRDQEIHARNQQIIQAIVAMVTSGALDDMTVE